MAEIYTGKGKKGEHSTELEYHGSEPHIHEPDSYHGSEPHIPEPDPYHSPEPHIPEPEVPPKKGKK